MADTRGNEAGDAGRAQDEAEDGEAGTTLVELVVALGLLALIALFIGEGLFALRRMAPVTMRLAGAAEVSAVRDHLTATLGEAMTELPLGARAPFSGTAETLRFVAPADPILEAGGLAEVTLFLRQGARGGLDLVEGRAVSRTGGGEAGSATVLLSGVAAARFSFAAAPEGQGDAGGAAAPDWRSAWSGDEAGLPALVRVEVELPPGDPRRFPPLHAHPVAALPPSLPER